VQSITFPTSNSVSAHKIELAALLYDLDGTLANTDPIHFRAWQEGLQPFGLDIDETFYKRRISGRLNPDIVADLLPQLSPEESRIFADRKEARFRELAPQLAPLPGLHEIIAWAKNRHFKQAVVTNAPTENARFMLKTLQLETVFDRLVLSDELGIGKPDPAPYLYSLQAFGIDASQAIAFEDSPSGIRSAVAAGIFTVGIASTQDPADLLAVGAAIVVPDFTAPELWKILDDN
jgi:HAD superfamily hydrolase (TIGR01509 family)